MNGEKPNKTTLKTNKFIRKAIIGKIKLTLAPISYQASYHATPMRKTQLCA